ncbi:MAG: nucleotidyltransferase domain-containing protein [Planctomycetota bacterium]
MPKIPDMFPHQRALLDRFIDHAATEPTFQAVIFGGSIAKGWHNEKSDIDLMVLVDEQDYRLRASENRTAVWDQRFSEIEWIAADVKYLDPSYLNDCADRANEPTKAAFLGAVVVWAREDPAPLESMIEQIQRYPEEGVDDRIASYLAQVEAMRWYMTQADKRSDPYLASWVAARAALYGCRVFLALNRQLYPYHKWLLHATDLCERKPDGLTDAAREMCRTPTLSIVERFCDMVLDYDNWPMRNPSWAELFIRDTELKWRTGEAPMEDQ